MSTISALVPVGWPIQYPFRAKAAFRNSANQPCCLKLDKGAEGYITQRVTVRTTEWVYCIIPGYTANSLVLKGWVPQDRLEIGTERRYGEIIPAFSVVSLRETYRGDDSDNEKIYVRTFLPNGAFGYWHEPFKARVQGDSTIVFEKRHRNNLGVWQLSISDNEAPHDGALIHTAFEVMPNRPHPTSWARLPAIGPWSDWHYAGRLAIRCEWQSAFGGWKRYYIQACEVNKLVNEDIPGSFYTYGRAMAMIRSLRNETIKHAPDWYRDMEFDLARVRKIAFDHLSQTEYVSPYVRRDDTALCWPGMLSQPQMIRRLVAAGAQNINGPVKYGTDGLWQPCDTCYVCRGICVIASGGQNCETCRFWCRPCSWTDRAAFPAALRMELSIPANTSSVFDIQDPTMTSFEQERPFS